MFARLCRVASNSPLTTGNWRCALKSTVSSLLPQSITTTMTGPYHDNQNQQHQNRRFTSSSVNFMALSEFRDTETRQKRMQEKVGRSWSVTELRRKSFEDLQKLWYVLYKERNMLLTEQQLSRRYKIQFPQPDRFYKVRKSMGAIQHVLGERKREKIAASALKQLQQSQRAENQNVLDTEVEDKADKESAK